MTRNTYQEENPIRLNQEHCMLVIGGISKDYFHSGKDSDVYMAGLIDDALKDLEAYAENESGANRLPNELLHAAYRGNSDDIVKVHETIKEQMAGPGHIKPVHDTKPGVIESLMKRVMGYKPQEVTV